MLADGEREKKEKERKKKKKKEEEEGRVGREEREKLRFKKKLGLGPKKTHGLHRLPPLKEFRPRNPKQQTQKITTSNREQKFLNAQILR